MAKTATGIASNDNPPISRSNRREIVGTGGEVKQNFDNHNHLPFSNGPKITLYKKLVIYTFYKTASFSFAMMTFTLKKLIPVAVKYHA